jgi:hypothetical protein
LGVSGGINVQATSGNPFNVKLVTPTGGAANFDNTRSYAWQIATAGSLSGYTPDAVALDSSAFSNDLAGGFFFLSADALTVNFTNNHPPVAATVTYLRPKYVSLKISVADLATNWSDPDGDAMQLVSVVSNSTNGQNNVSTDGTHIFYTAGVGGDVPDAISYTIRDLRSSYRPGDTVRTAQGTIVIEIAPPPTNQTQNIVGISALPDGNRQIAFAGVPGYAYLVQATTNLVSPVWETVSTNVAGANGQWTFSDLNSTNYPSRFYRSAIP